MLYSLEKINKIIKIIFFYENYILNVFEFNVFTCFSNIFHGTRDTKNIIKLVYYISCKNTNDYFS